MAPSRVAPPSGSGGGGETAVSAEHSGPPAMRDVAALAGVSHQTVSRVLNDHPNVSARTKERVEKAIAELGYRHNLTARALAKGKTSTIGLLMSRSTDFGPSNIVLAVGTAAQERGYFVSMAPLAELDQRQTDAGINQLLAQGVDGIVAVISHREVASAIERNPPPRPTVVVTSQPGMQDSPSLRYVCIDQGLGARLAVEYLIGMGHRRIWHIAGPSDWLDAQERELAYVTAMTEAGLEPVVISGATDWTPEGGYLVGPQVAAAARQPGGPSAVFAANDALAMGLISALREAHLRVPDDVSVVGFDDAMTSKFYVPPLTTIRQPFAEVGRAAVDMLVDMLEAPSDDETQSQVAVFEPELVVRRSVLPVRN